MKGSVCNINSLDEDMCCAGYECTGTQGNKNEPGICVVTTIAQNRAGGSGHVPKIPSASVNRVTGKTSSQPYSLSINGILPTKEVLAARRALQKAIARGGHQKLTGKFEFK